MKKLILYFFPFASIIFLSSCLKPTNKSDDQLNAINRIAQNIRTQMAPDARDHVFEINIRQGQNGNFILTGSTDLNKARRALVDSLKARKISYVDSVQLLPVPAFKNKVGVVRLSVANLRTKPKHSAELASQMLMGMPVRILEQKDGFFRIRTIEGYLGWTEEASIQIMDKKDFSRWTAAPKVVMSENYGKIYAEPVIDTPQVSDIVKNDVVILLQQTPDYLHIELPDGRRGYVPANYFVTIKEWETLNRQFATVNDIITKAKMAYTGIPYMWGGTSVKALDCSGFTKDVFQNFGYLLPRDASQQARVVHPVPLTPKLDSLQPADLLFFGTRKADGTPKITHVAMYVGGGRIIHATGEVKIESLFPDDSLYNDARRKTLLAAGRVFRQYDRFIYPYYTSQALKIFFPG